VKGNRVVESRTGELMVLVGELRALHEELLAVIRQKLTAIRHADIEGLGSCQAREQFLSDRIRQREGLRQQLVQLIGKELGMTAEQTVRLPLSSLAERLTEPRRSQLLALAASTRQVVLAVDHNNKVSALVMGEMLKHFRQVCLAMARTGMSTGTYSSGGRMAPDLPARVFEAVG